MASTNVPNKRSEPSNAVDACDLVDAVDAVDIVDTGATSTTIASTTSESGREEDADFDAFGTARTLQGETVADAQAAAAAENTDQETKKDQKDEDPKLEVDNTAEARGDDERRFVTPGDFELLKVIGMGAFGKVLQVKNRQSKQVLAMKIISKRLLKRKAGYIENIHAERNILMRVKHPFVVTMHCSFQTREKLFIIMDFLAGGELFLRLGREGIFLEKDAAFYLAEIILGVDHLHALGILHRDLKPENILLGRDGHICLTDFGLAKDFGPNWNADDGEGDRANTICGTQEYMAPEMVANKGYAKAADYWSLGCIAYEMLNGLPPFSSKQGSKELFRKIMSEKVKMPPGSTAGACKMLKGLLNRNPDARWGCARSTMFEVGGVTGLKQCAFFAKIDWAKLEKKELKPPYDLSVETDDDLRHFHDDFLNMPLPRSVREMSEKDMLPKRVQSQAFRGFSFIQPEFKLPERNANDVNEYWSSKAVDDGESDSEIASSKCEEEAAEVPAQPEKKKRPPRKRKKKKNKDADTMSTTSTAPSEQGDATPEEKVVPSDRPTTTEPIPATTEIKQEQAAPTTSTSATSKPTSATPAPTASATSKITASASKDLQRKPKTTTPQKPKEEVWQSVAKTKPTPRRGAQPGTKGANDLQARQLPRINNTPAKQAAIPGHSIQQSPSRLGWGSPSAVSTPQRSPGPPGSWSSRLQQGASSLSTPSSTRAEPPTPWSNRGGVSSQPAIDTVPSPSSDWRYHSSPQVQRALTRSIANSSSPPALPPQSTTTKWPSLGGTPNGSKKNKQQQAQQKPVEKVALRGAWASRPKP